MMKPTDPAETMHLVRRVSECDSAEIKELFQSLSVPLAPGLGIIYMAASVFGFSIFPSPPTLLATTSRCVSPRGQIFSWSTIF